MEATWSFFQKKNPCIRNRNRSSRFTRKMHVNVSRDVESGSNISVFPPGTVCPPSVPMIRAIGNCNPSAFRIAMSRRLNTYGAA